MTVMTTAIVETKPFEPGTTGWTVHGEVAKYAPHADKLPLALQDHGRKVRYRDIWVRELHETE